MLVKKIFNIALLSFTTPLLAMELSVPVTAKIVVTTERASRPAQALTAARHGEAAYNKFYAQTAAPDALSVLQTQITQATDDGLFTKDFLLSKLDAVETQIQTFQKCETLYNDLCNQAKALHDQGHVLTPAEIIENGYGIIIRPLFPYLVIVGCNAC